MIARYVFICMMVIAVGLGYAYGAAPEKIPPQEAVGFRFTTNHTNALYRCGEEAVFTVTATNGLGQNVTAGTIQMVLDNYGSRVFARQTFDLARENPFVVKGSLKEPGFLRVTCKGKGVRPRSPSRWSVGYDPTLIRPAAAAPADFDAFWAKALADIDKSVPLDPKLVYQPERSKGAFDYWRVSFATLGGTRVWGFLSVPKDKSKAPFPVSFEVPSAGTGAWSIDMRGEPDRVRMYITVHRFDPPATVAENVEIHRKLTAELGCAYSVFGLDGKGPEDYYFYRALLGINRAANWLWEQSYVDRTRFGYVGGSQGGFFGWMLCGLNPKFTSAVLNVPAGSDMRAALVDRASSWPNPLGAFPKSLHATVLRNMAYYDPVSFAPRIKCPIRVIVGFTDNTCPPANVYATYNVLGSKDKAMIDCIGKGHGGQTYEGSRKAAAWQKSLR